MAPAGPASCRRAATWSPAGTSLLGNANVTICWVAADRSSELYRNAAGDELVYLHAGAATLESVFGRLEVGRRRLRGRSRPRPRTAGSCPPAAGCGRWCSRRPATSTIPPRYLTATGQLREGAPFSERDLRPPQEPLVVDDDGPVPVLVRTRQGWSRHCHARHPFDVVGWDGCAYPFALSIRDFEPIVGRIHQPPPVHQTFAGPGFVVCSFVPRPFDFDPESVKVPYHHANVDSDEVLFYADGRLHEPAGRRHRGRVADPAPGGIRARPPAGQRGGVGRGDPHRRDGGHDRHLRPAGDQRRQARSVADCRLSRGAGPGPDERARPAAGRRPSAVRPWWPGSPRRSPCVVSGWRKAKRATVSPSHLVGVTKPIWSASSWADQAS